MLWTWTHAKDDIDKRTWLKQGRFGRDSWNTSLQEADYVVVDMETSGFSPRRDVVLSVAAAQLNLNKVPKVQSFYCQLVTHPDLSMVAPHIWELTGLSPQRLQSGCSWKDALYGLLQRGAGRVWVTHHARHELAFLQTSTKAMWNLRIQPIVIDTALVAQALFHSPEAPSLETACEWFDITLARRHRADEDVQMTLALWEKEVEMCIAKGVGTVAEVIEWVHSDAL